MNTTAKLLCSLTLLTLFLVPAWAGSPEYINYQGLLNGANGQPLPTGNYTNEFNIYDQATGVTKVWGPFIFDGGSGNGHGPLVPVANGRFNVIIGPLDTTSRLISTAFGSSNRFVEIKVNNGSPILPRQQFLSTPYAFKANFADQAALATVASSVTDVNVAYRNTANTFTDNQTVNGNATVTGNVTASGNVLVGTRGVAVGEENLRIVRGSVNANGTIASGSGFTSATLGTGYRITFTQPFSAPPSVTATLFGYQNWMPGVAGYNENTLAPGTAGTGPSTNGFIVYVVTGNSGGLALWPFCFTAIGPR